MHAVPIAWFAFAGRRDSDAQMIRHRLQTPADYRRMPWKNGAGRTTEIAAFPPGAALDEFDWRVSIADVVRDAPFSAFAGVDRTIVLLAGAGMRLAGVGGASSLRAVYEPHAFSGDETVNCTLVDGPVRDFNLMLRRGRVTGEVAIVRGAAARIAPARFCLCYAAAGASECVTAGQPPQRIPPDHALLIEDASATGAVPAVNPLTADAVAIVCRIE